MKSRLLFYDWRYYEILTESSLIISDKSIISLCVLCALCGEPISPIGNLCGVVRNYYSSTFHAQSGSPIILPACLEKESFLQTVDRRGR